jgi:hypothetical protein
MPRLGKKISASFFVHVIRVPLVEFSRSARWPAAQRLTSLEGIGLNLCPCVEINLVDGFMCGSGFETDYLF